MSLSEAQGQKLVQLARQSLENHLLDKKHDLGLLWEEAFDEERGVFVTLQKQGELRGCIGNIMAYESIFKAVPRLALESALSDHRFDPVKERELDSIKIEVSILTEPQPIEGFEEIRPGIDGVVLSGKGHRATFLPQVWESLPEKGAFLSALCRKAGLSPDAWDLGLVEYETYQVEHYNEP